MRPVLYALSAVVAAAVAYLFATTPVPGGAPSASAPSSAVASHKVMPASGTMVLQVDDMHCPFACYPAVKKTLEGQGNVLEVELADQKEEGVIDNPQVLVKYDSGFDLTAALESLAKNGFTQSSVVE